MGTQDTAQRKPRLYGTWRWQKIRAAQLAGEPLCRMCADQGRVTPASVADHVEPHKGDEDKFWNGKLQSLCKRCHDSDKQREERGGKAKVRFGPDGWPVKD